MGNIKFVNSKLGAFDKKPVRYRLIQSYVVIMLMSVFVAALGLFSMTELSKRVQHFNDKSIEIVDESWTARRNLLAAQNSIYKLCLTNDAQKAEKYIQEETTQMEGIRASLEELSKLSSLDSDLIQKAEQQLDSLDSIRQEIITYGSSMDDGQIQKAVAQLDSSYIPVVEEINENLLSIAESAHAEADQYAVSSKQSYYVFLGCILAVLAMAGFLTFSVSVRTIVGVLRPLEEVGVALSELTEGNLNFHLEYRSENEFGELTHKIRTARDELKKYVDNIDEVLGALAKKDFDVNVDVYYKGDFYNIKESMKEIISVLNHITSRIKNTAVVVTENSEQISAISQTLADGASEQSSTVAQLLATITDVTEQVNENAKMANQVSDKSIKAGDIINTGNDYMQQLVSAMEKITESSKEISNIISVISDISNQTNMLALNASIEAARAGEHGKGFAVVAGQIGELAAQTKEATKSSADLINDSLESVENGERLVTETAAVLEEVVSAAGDITVIANEVSAASDKQVSALREIDAAVGQISNVVDNNSSIAEEAAASSDGLTGEAEKLRDIMLAFKLKAE